MRIKKILICFVVVLLIVKSPIIAYAESAPGTVTVKGGSIGSGGIEGNSTALKGTALAVLMATLASVGIQVKLAVDDYSHGNSAFNYIEDKFNEWESKAQTGWDAYSALNSTKVGADGELYVNEQGSNVIQKFLNWLYANDEVKMMSASEGDAPTVNGTYYGSSINWKNVGNNNNSFSVVDGSSVAFVQIPWKNSYVIAAYSNNTFNINKVMNNSLLVTSSSTYYNGYYYTVDTGNFAQTYERLEQLLLIPTAGSLIDAMRNYLSSLDGFTPSEPGADVIDQTGLYTENTDIPQLVDETGNGKILTVQPGLIGQVQDAYTGSNNATINIQDYLDALRDLYGQQAIPQEITDLPDITIPGEDAITGTKEDVAAIDREIALNPDITLPADADAITWPEVPEIAVPVADPSVPSDPDVSIPAMSLDLTQYFPFCLPFDIYHILQKLNADPVTPEVTVDWGDILGSFGIDYVMQLDLHDYDNLAELLRNMETAAFVVGLAVVTRQMFLRG